MQLYGPFDNYIPMHRKQAGLQQDELAILLGLEGRGAVARYEKALRSGEFKIPIALELIFDEPIQSIFAGVTHQVNQDLRGRAWALLMGMSDKASDENVHKLETLSRLARFEEQDGTPWESRS